ncbi:MAG: hypothetical protein H0W85_00640 [Methylotenera sp.]|nr:hypothetical protein [Methylotenera sp.]
MMHWNEIETRWGEFSKKAHSNWNKLTEDQINKIGGKRDELSHLIQSCYHCDQTEAENQIELWLSNLLGSSHLAEVEQPGVKQSEVEQSEFNQLFNSQLLHQVTLDDKLKENQNSVETIREQDEIVGSPYHKGY